MIHDKHNLELAVRLMPDESIFRLDKMLKKADKDREFLIMLSLPDCTRTAIEEDIKRGRRNAHEQGHTEAVADFLQKIRKHLEENP